MGFAWRAIVLQVKGIFEFRTYRIQTLYVGTGLLPAARGVTDKGGSEQRSMVTGPREMFSTVVTGDPEQRFAAALVANDAAVEASPANVSVDVAAPAAASLAGQIETNSPQAGGRFMSEMRSSFSLLEQVMDEVFADVDDFPLTNPFSNRQVV
jgi:hypothetical protein